MESKSGTDRQESIKETVVCARCGGIEHRPRFSIQGFTIADCNRCGLRFVNPRLTEAAINNLYTRDYYRSQDSVVYGYDDYLSERDTIIKTFERRWRAMAPFLPATGRMLDIGAACGFLLEVAGSQGWQAEGLEVSADMAAHGREHFGHTIAVGGFGEQRYGEGVFALVTMWDTIEHATDPVNDLRIIARAIKPGGILSLVTPDSGSFHAIAVGRKWVEYQRPQEHLYFFTHQNLASILQELGFDVVRRITAGKYVKWRFALNRLRCYWPRTVGVIETIFGRIGLIDRFTYIDPRDKTYLIARKKS